MLLRTRLSAQSKLSEDMQAGTAETSHDSEIQLHMAGVLCTGAIHGSIYRESQELDPALEHVQHGCSLDLKPAVCKEYEATTLTQGETWMGEGKWKGALPCGSTGTLAKLQDLEVGGQPAVPL